MDEFKKLLPINTPTLPTIPEAIVTKYGEAIPWQTLHGLTDDETALLQGNGLLIHANHKDYNEFILTVANLDGKSFGTGIAIPLKVDEVGTNLYHLHIQI